MTETIGAIATPPGRGGIGIVRVSGPGAPAVAEKNLGQCPPPRIATHAVFRDANADSLDEASKKADKFVELGYVTEDLSDWFVESIEIEGPDGRQT